MPDQPNILLFLTDDHGAWAMGCAGNRAIRTPNLDRLASEGTRFTQAMCTCPVSSPARASLLTGHYPSRHGIRDWLEEWGKDADHPGLIGQQTLADILSARGYHVGLVGKWHCGNASRAASGFDFWFTHARGWQYPHRGETTWIDQHRTVTRSGQQSEIITTQTLRFLRERPSDKPFFLIVGHTSTHAPFVDQPDDLVASYASHRFDEIPKLPPHPQLSPHPWSPQNESERIAMLVQYYAAVTDIDRQVGRVVQELIRERVLEQTTVIYSSDHGHNNGHHGVWGKGNATRPYNLFDGSLRVPLIIRSPAATPGTVDDRLVNHCDLHTTLACLGGAAADPDRPGRDLLESRAHQSDPSQLFAEYGDVRCMRTANTKVVSTTACSTEPKLAKFDLLTDPYELVPRSVTSDDPLACAIDEFLLRYGPNA